MNTNFNGPWFDLTSIEPRYTVLVADALSTVPLIGHRASIMKEEIVFVRRK